MDIGRSDTSEKYEVKRLLSRLQGSPWQQDSKGDDHRYDLKPTKSAPRSGAETGEADHENQAMVQKCDPQSAVSSSYSSGEGESRSQGVCGEQAGGGILAAQVLLQVDPEPTHPHHHHHHHHHHQQQDVADRVTVSQTTTLSTPREQHEPQGTAAYHRCDPGVGNAGGKGTRKLGKSPISVITVSATRGVLCTVTGAPSHCEPREPAEQEVAEQPNVSGKICQQQQARDASREEGAATSSMGRDLQHQLSGRRRLSSTIKQLQEKILKEMADNGHIPVKPGVGEGSGGRETSGKGGGRFRRDRSRKRSKSRVGFKVRQTARRYPPVPTRERPYRQWMGVASCRTPDTRYIVASAEKPEQTPAPRTVYGPRRPNTFIAEDVKEKGEVGHGDRVIEGNSDGDFTAEMLVSENQAAARVESPPGEKLAGDGPPSCNADATLVDGGGFPTLNGVSSMEDKPELSSLAVDKSPGSIPSNGQSAACTENNFAEDHASWPRMAEVKSRSPAYEAETPDSGLYKVRSPEQRKISPSRSSPSSAYDPPPRERSRRSKRALADTGRSPRPPTPHRRPQEERGASLSPEPPDLRGHTPSPAPRTFRGHFSHSIRSGRHLDSLRDEQGGPIPCTASPKGRHSACEHVVNRRSSCSKPRLPVYGSMRTSKLLTSASKYSRRTALVESRRAVPLATSHEGSTALATSHEGSSALLDQQTSCHGSVETLWSDVSTTTGGSSVLADFSGLGVCDGLPGKHGSSSCQQWHTQAPSTIGLAGDYHQTSASALAHGAGQTRRYVDVQAMADFKGLLPGQLSFHKGQVIKQLVSSSLDSSDEMSYGYYRAGRFKRKKKGLFPSVYVAPFKGTEFAKSSK